MYIITKVSHLYQYVLIRQQNSHIKISLGIIINCVNCDNLLGVFLKKCFYETIIYTATYH